MIKINLLPDESKKKRSPLMGVIGAKIRGLSAIGIAAGICAALLLAQISVIIIDKVVAGKLASAAKRYNEILPEKRESEVLSKKAADIAKRSSAIDELTTKRFSWSRKLNFLSDCMTPGIWLSDLYYDEKPIANSHVALKPGALIISGYASGSGDEVMSLIGKFIKSLQDNSGFYSDFSSISLVSTKSDKTSGQLVMSFRISCLFK